MRYEVYYDKKDNKRYFDYIYYQKNKKDNKQKIKIKVLNLLHFKNDSAGISWFISVFKGVHRSLSFITENTQFRCTAQY